MSASEIAGGFFLLPDEHDGWQGQFISDADSSGVLVQLFSWLTGEPTCQKLMSTEKLMAATIFETIDEWHAAADRFSATGKLS